MNAAVISVLLLVFIASGTSTMFISSYFATTIAYGKPNSDSNITEGSLDIYNISLKTVHVGDLILLILLRQFLRTVNQMKLTPISQKAH